MGTSGSAACPLDLGRRVSVEAGALVSVQGIRTLIAVNSTAVAEQQAGHQQTDLEAWRFYGDDEQGPTGAYRGLHSGDTRAAVAPYLAHHVCSRIQPPILASTAVLLTYCLHVRDMCENAHRHLP